MSIFNKTLIMNNNEYKKFNSEKIIVPKLSSNVDQGFEITTSSTLSGEYYLGYKSFDYTNDLSGWASTTTSGWISVKLPNQMIVNKYKILARNYNAGIQTNSHGAYQAPKSWTFEGSNDGLNWTILDIRKDVIGYLYGVYKEFSFFNETKYQYYRLNVTEINGSTTYLTIGEIVLIDDSLYWSSVSSTLPTSTQFIEHGMDLLSPLFDRKETLLGRSPMSQDISWNKNGKVFKKSVDLNKYTNISNIRAEVR